MSELNNVFCDNFWGDRNLGFGVLLLNMKQGAKASSDLTDFLRESCAIEDSYQKSLVKLANKVNSYSNSGSFMPLWTALRSTVERLAIIHLEVQQVWTALAKDVQRYIDEQAKRHKTVREAEQGTQDVVDSLQKTTALLTKARETYSLRFSEFQKIRAVVQDSGGGGGGTVGSSGLSNNLPTFNSMSAAVGSTHQPTSKELEKTESRLKKARNEYQYQTECYNNVRDDFQRKMTNSAKHFEDLEVKHLDQMRDFLRRYGCVWNDAREKLGKLYLEFDRDMEDFTVGRLLDRFVAERSTGSHIPPPASIGSSGEAAPALINSQSLANVSNNSYDLQTASQQSLNADNVSDGGFNIRASSREKRNLYAPTVATAPPLNNEAVVEDLLNLDDCTLDMNNREQISTSKKNQPSRWVMFSGNRRRRGSLDRGGRKRKSLQSQSNSAAAPRSGSQSTTPGTTAAAADLISNCSSPPTPLAPPTTANDDEQWELDAEGYRVRLHVDTNPWGQPPRRQSSSSSGEEDSSDSDEEDRKMRQIKQINIRSKESVAPVNSTSNTAELLRTVQAMRLSPAPAITSIALASMLHTPLGAAANNAGAGSTSRPRPPSVAGMPRSRSTTDQLLFLSSDRSTPTPNSFLTSQKDSAPAERAATVDNSAVRQRPRANTPDLQRMLDLRAPSPMVLGSNVGGTSFQEYLPLATALTETVHAKFQPGQRHVKILGEISVAFPTDIVSKLATAPALVFCLSNTQLWQKHVCNQKLVTEELTLEPNNSFQLTMCSEGVAAQLRKLAADSPQAAYFNLEVLRYEVRYSEAGFALPLVARANWRCLPESTDLRIELSRAYDELHEVRLQVPVTGKVASMQSLPQGTWSVEHERAAWTVPLNSPTATIRAKFDLQDGPSSPAPVALQFYYSDKLLSGAQLSLIGSGYRVSLYKKRVISGTYLIEPDSDVTLV